MIFMEMILTTAVKTLAAYLLLLLTTRFMGRKIISQMTFFDFAVGVTVGSVTANLALGSQPNSLIAATVLITLGILTIITGFAHIKSNWIRKTLNSEPVVMVQNGKIVEGNLDTTRLTLNELMMKLREKNVFNMNDVEFAILETDGKLSVLPKSQKQPLTPGDMGISTSYKGLTKDLIIDGNIMYENLADIKLDEEWLKGQLEKKDIKNVDEVFYAGLDTLGNLYVSTRSDEGEKHGEYGIE